MDLQRKITVWAELSVADALRMDSNETAETPSSPGVPMVVFLFLSSLIAFVILGNFLVIVTVLLDRKLRTVTTNKFIASLAISDLLIGIVVMPLSLFSKVQPRSVSDGR